MWQLYQLGWYDLPSIALSSKSRNNLGIVDCFASFSIPVYPGALVGISRRLLGNVCEVHNMDVAFVVVEVLISCWNQMAILITASLRGLQLD